MIRRVNLTKPIFRIHFESICRQTYSNLQVVLIDNGSIFIKDADDFCRYYERLADAKGLYLSHIIYSMLLDKRIFRPIQAKEYIDFEERK